MAGMSCVCNKRSVNVAVVLLLLLLFVLVVGVVVLVDDDVLLVVAAAVWKSLVGTSTMHRNGSEILPVDKPSMNVSGLL